MSDPHHVQTRGAGGADLYALPFCRRCHRRCHDMGRKSFKEAEKINLWREVCRHITRYLSHADVTI